MLGLALCGSSHSASAAKTGWFEFSPGATRDEPTAIDLRSLNEKVAGENGFVSARAGHFYLAKSKTPTRFWAVNGPSESARTFEDLQREAKLLARYGVNLVRVHGAMYDENGVFDDEQVQRRIDIVEAMKREGIYVHFSIYFPLWLKPLPSNAWLKGYDGEKHPFAALMFNPSFQEQYREWWKRLLLTPSRRTGRKLIDDSAVFGAELQNEDSDFFWTFSAENLPEPQRELIEHQFFEWLKKKYQDADNAFGHWSASPLPIDSLAKKRIGIRPLPAILRDRGPRDRDTAAFLLESQRHFYEEHYRFLRELGFKGLITCSNWITADPAIFGPLEKYSYTVGDFIDRHGYFGVPVTGEASEWSIRPGQTYNDRSALRFEAEDGPKGARLFVHPAMDPKYNNMPSMISETTWTRPNRFRSEAPLYLASYGSLQGSDAIVHFAFDGSSWSVRPNFWMQPWTICSPSMMGQFPAAALIFRASLISEGDPVLDLKLNLDELLELKGTPLAQDAALDELRLKDLPPRPTNSARPELIDPLIHYVGRTNVLFERDAPTSSRQADLSRFIDRATQSVRSSSGQLHLDYGRGLLRIDAPGVQGVSGALAKAGQVDCTDLSFSSGMEQGHIVVIALDGKPISKSTRLLLQVMSEEEPSEWRVSATKSGAKKIQSIGHDPWLVKDFSGEVIIREDASTWHATALDQAGRRSEKVELEKLKTGARLRLNRSTLYYLFEREAAD